MLAHELIAFAHAARLAHAAQLGHAAQLALRRARSRATHVRAAAELRLESARLELWPCSAEACRASLRGPEALQSLLGVEVPATWPPGDLVDALALHAGGRGAGDGERGWGIWLLVAKQPRCLVGSTGFKGAPDRSGCVEVGYGIEPAWRRRGFATEAVARLVEWAWAQEVERIVAECHEDNLASARVLERSGMRLQERRGKMLWWELRRPR